MTAKAEICFHSHAGPSAHDAAQSGSCKEEEDVVRVEQVSDLQLTHSSQVVDLNLNPNPNPDVVQVTTFVIARRPAASLFSGFDRAVSRQTGGTISFQILCDTQIQTSCKACSHLTYLEPPRRLLVGTFTKTADCRSRCGRI